MCVKCDAVRATAQRQRVKGARRGKASLQTGAAALDERTARLAGGVRAIQSRSGRAQRALFIAGGSQLLLPLFAQLESPPEPGIVNCEPGAAASPPGGRDGCLATEAEYDEALELVMFLLQLVLGESGGTMLSEMHYLIGAVPTISALLHARPDPRVLSTGFLGAVMLMVRDLLPLRAELAREVVSILFCTPHLLRENCPPNRSLPTPQLLLTFCL